MNLNTCFTNAYMHFTIMNKSVCTILTFVYLENVSLGVFLFETIYKYAYIYTCTCTDTCVHNIHSYIHTYVQVQFISNIYVYIHSFIHTYMHNSYLSNI